MSDFLIFKAAFNNSATPAIGTYTAEGVTASFTQNASLSPDYYLYNPLSRIAPEPPGCACCPHLALLNGVL